MLSPETAWDSEERLREALRAVAQDGKPDHPLSKLGTTLHC